MVNIKINLKSIYHFELLILGLIVCCDFFNHIIVLRTPYFLSIFLDKDFKLKLVCPFVCVDRQKADFLKFGNLKI